MLAAPSSLVPCLRHSDFPTIMDSIRTRLLTLPPETVVHPGHGTDTTIGA